MVNTKKLRKVLPNNLGKGRERGKIYVLQGFFFYTFEKTQGEKNLNFSAFGRKLKPYFFKNLKLLEILSTWQFFKKNLNIFKAVKGNFLCIFNPKLEKKRKNRAKREKNNTFPPIFALKLIFSGNSSNLEKNSINF